MISMFDKWMKRIDKTDFDNLSKTHHTRLNGEHLHDPIHVW